MNIGINILPIAPQMTGIGSYTYDLWKSTSFEVSTNHSFLYIANPRMNPWISKNTSRSSYLCVDQPNFFWEQLHMPSELRQKKIDVYHSPLFTCPIVDEFVRVITIHDVIPLAKPELSSPAFVSFFKKHAPYAIRAAQKIVTTSHYSQREITKYLGVDEENIEVVYQSISDDFHPRSTEEVNKALQKYSLPKKYLLYVGMIEPRKNLEKLCQALQQVQKEIPEIHLVIVGKKDDKNYPLENIIKNLGLEKNVTILGYITKEDLPILYSGATSFVFPSLYEGFGRPVIEAMACGTPVICSQTTSLSEIAHNAVTLINPEDIKNIAQSIISVWTDTSKQSQLKSAGLERAKNFTQAKFAERLNNFYDGLEQVL